MLAKLRGITTQRLLLINTHVSWALMALTCLLMLMAEFLKEFLPANLPAFILIVGFLWSIFGIGLSVIALYFAKRENLLSLWGLSSAMSGMSLYSYMQLIAMH